MPQLRCGTAKYIFIVSDFTFRTTIYFELVFVYSMNNGFKFVCVFLNMVSVVQHHLLKRLCFLLYIAFVKKKEIATRMYGFIFELYSISFICLSVDAILLLITVGLY